jgi:hypothetical protein
LVQAVGQILQAIILFLGLLHQLLAVGVREQSQLPSVEAVAVAVALV